MGIQINGVSNKISSGSKIDFPGSVGVAGTLTYEDVANVDSVGLITARTGINIGPTAGVAGTFFADGSYVTAGVVTATTFHGSGANLTGIDTDLVADTSPQLGGNLDANSKNIVFGDSSGTTVNRLTFGAGTDLSIRHNGTDTIFSNATGDLYINNTGSNSDDIIIKAKDDVNIQVQDGENAIVAKGDGAVEIYHNNVKKFDTITTGIRVHGDEGGTAQLQLLADEGDDNPDYWRFIAETNGILNIQDYGSGNWYNNIRLTGNTGGVELYHNNSKKFHTFDSGVVITGDAQWMDGHDAQFGSSADLKIYHNGTDSYIANGTNNFRIGNTGSTNLKFFTNNSTRWNIDGSGHFIPDTTNAVDIGSSSVRVRNIYTQDLQLSNEAKKDKGGNDVDGTWGDWTLQEGESDIYMINNRSGKKFRIKMEEV